MMSGAVKGYIYANELSRDGKVDRKVLFHPTEHGSHFLVPAEEWEEKSKALPANEYTENLLISDYLKKAKKKAREEIAEKCPTTNVTFEVAVFLKDAIDRAVEIGAEAKAMASERQELIHEGHEPCEACGELVPPDAPRYAWSGEDNVIHCMKCGGPDEILYRPE